MKKGLLFALEVCIGTFEYTWSYLHNRHRIAISEKLYQAIQRNEKEIAVYFQAGGYRWSVRERLVRELRQLGVSRMKPLHDQYDALLAILTPSQIEAMGKKRWVPGMWLASEMLALEEARLKDDFHTHKASIEQALRGLHEKYQL